MDSSKIVKTRQFADFEQVLIKLDILLTLNKLSNTINKLPWSNQMPRHSFFWGHYPVTRTPPWLLRPVKASTSSELYPDTRLLGFFLNALAPSLLILHMWLTGHHAAPGVTHTHLRKRMISLGVAIILSICLHSHT